MIHYPTNVGGKGDEQGRRIVEQYQFLKKERTLWEPTWKEVADYFMPNFRFSIDNDGRVKTVGDRRNKHLYELEGVLAVNKLAAIMESLITPRGGKWHSLRHSVKDVANDIEAQRWFDTATDALFRFRYAPEANYATQQFATYQSLVTFGTGAMYIDQLETGGLRYAALHIAQYVFDVNHQGVIDTVIRGPITLSARNAVEKFGEENLPDDIVKAWRDKEYSKTFDFIHYVGPNDSREYGREDAKGMPFKGCYVELTSGTTVQERGYRAFPYAISRFTTAPGEKHGRSPAMDALPNMKTLNDMKRTYLKAGHRRADPVLLTHDDGLLDTVQIVPGQVVTGALTAEGRQLLVPLDAGDYNLSVDLMDREKAQIRAAFMLDIFQLMAEGEMTATEVVERSREKSAFLAPTFGRQETESLGVMIPRELQVLIDGGYLPPMPDSILENGLQFDIIFDSPLSRSQRAEEMAGTMRALDIAVSYATNTQNPAILDYYNFDEIMPTLALNQAMPARMLRSPEEVQKIRDERAEQQQIQQAIQAAPAAAAMARTTGGGAA